MDFDTRLSPGFPSEGTSMANEQVPGDWVQRYLAARTNRVGRISDLVGEVEKDAMDHQRLETEKERLMQTMNIVGGYCEKCRHHLKHWPDLSTGDWRSATGRSFSTVCEIEAATRAGCEFCAFIRSRLFQEELLDTFQRIESRLISSGHDGSTSLTIQQFGEGPLARQLVWLDLPGKKATDGNWTIAPDVHFYSTVVEPFRMLQKNKHDPYQLVRMWLRDCDANHKVCVHNKKYEQPARLLYFNLNVVKVVRTETFDSVPPYATLSYCWGHKPFTMLKENTMKSFLEGVCVSDLPQTFRDAIHVAKELGLSHIWIDALCIIQNDPQDWSTESGRMRSVYGNSYVNLAASTATNVHEGFLSKPKDYERYSGGFSARVSTDEYSVVRIFHSPSVYDESCTWSHLATRAWTLQERLLPARTVYFGNTGIFWECRSDIKSEFLPHGFFDLSGLHLLRPEDQAWPWDGIFGQYSCANLTDPEDKLPALAGVARRQHEVTGHHYLAGMWRESIVLGMTWSVRERRKRPAWRAPSWSWTAVDSPVSVWGSGLNLNKEGLKQYIKVLDAWTTPSSPDPFGKVSDGLLSLACSALVRAQPLEKDADADAKKTNHYQYVRLDAVSPRLPVLIDALDDEWSCDEVYLLPVYGGKFGDRFRRRRPKHKGEEEGGMKDHEDDKSDASDDFEEVGGNEQVICGLVLRASGENTGDGGRFSRIGSFQLRDLILGMNPKVEEEPERDYYQEFIQVLDGEGHKPVDAKRLTETRGNEHVQKNLNITVE